MEKDFVSEMSHIIGKHDMLSIECETAEALEPLEKLTELSVAKLRRIGGGIDPLPDYS